MIAWIVSVNVPRTLIVAFAAVGMAMIRDFASLTGGVVGLDLSDSIRVVARYRMSRRQQHAERHREGDGEGQYGTDAALRHGEQVLSEILTKV